jgi:hypothetical protein
MSMPSYHLPPRRLRGYLVEGWRWLEEALRRARWEASNLDLRAPWGGGNALVPGRVRQSGQCTGGGVDASASIKTAIACSLASR